MRRYEEKNMSRGPRSFPFFPPSRKSGDLRKSKNTFPSEKKAPSSTKKKKRTLLSPPTPAGNAADISPSSNPIITQKQKPKMIMSITSGSIVTSTTSSPTTPNSSSSSTKGNGNTQACAACKYQRRKCAPDCILAPYFPHDRQRQFLNAHKLFGVSNITKIIKHLDHFKKEEAMRTIMFQSDVRASDPVGGCYRIIQELQRLIDYHKAELDIVLHQLAICRAQAQQQQPLMQQQIPEVGDSTCSDQMISVDLYGNPIHFQYLQPQHMHNVQITAGQQEQGAPYVFMQDANGNGNNQHLVPEDMSMWAMQDSMSSLHIKHGMSAGDCEDVKPFVDIPCDDDQRSHEIKFQPADAICDQSDDALLKIDNGNLKEEQQIESAVQHHDHGDLKDEPSLFMTLTNCSS